MLDNFSSGAQKAILLAEAYAQDFHHPTVGTEHLLLALLKNEDILLTKELSAQGIKHKGFFDKTKRLYEKEKRLTYINYSLELKEVLQEAIKYGNKNKEMIVSIDSLSLVLISLNTTARELLMASGVDVDKIVKKLLAVHKKKSELLSISDLHLLGSNNKDPLIGRDNEIVQLIYSLSRRNKPNAILIGEPGVGKTAIVEELAKRLINGKVPLLKDKLIYELDLASTVSGTKYRGEFEDKLKKIIKKVKEDGKAILFIDEIHNVIKAGGAEGAIDASNILKPYLARGEIQIIGATTLEEFNDSFDKDKALKRRFQIIDINEPNKEETINILKKIKPIYEDYYNITIEDENLLLIVDLADKYLINQRFPDKAIELLDNACVISEESLKENSIIETMNKLYNVSIHDNEKIELLKTELEKEIIGQNSVKEKILDVFLFDKVKSLLFVGQNGSGKSKVAEIIAKTVYKDNFINLKIDNYLELNGINKLVSNGFSINGEQSSILVKTLKEKPNSVVFVEGIDRINNELKIFFSGLLEKGYFLDSKGKKINTSHALFIFTMTDQDDYVRFTTNPSKVTSISQKVKRVENKVGYQLFSLFDEVLFFEKIDQVLYKNLVKKNLEKMNKEISIEVSSIQDVDEIELSQTGGDAALKKAKEIIRDKKTQKIKIN